MRLKELRTRDKLKQKDIADKIGISATAYSYYETGQRRPDPEMLMKLARYFGVSVDYLLGNEPSATETPEK